MITKNAVNEKQISVTFGFRGKAGYFGSEKAKEEANIIAAAGIKWVVLVPTVFVEDCMSTRQFIDFECTPSDLEVVEMIEYFHKLGIKVQLRPMLEGHDGCGRTEVVMLPDLSHRMPGGRPSTREAWFRSMTARSRHYAAIAEKCGCEMYCLDSDLDRIVGFNDDWKKVVSEVRKVYSGPVTSCHTIHAAHVNFEKMLSDKNCWFYDLDMLSISSYYPAADKPHTTVAEMKEKFAPLAKRVDNIAAMYGKPILFGELGCTSSTGAAIRPWSWQREGAVYDGEEQANYLTAFFETFSGKLWWRGFCWWKWDENVDRPDMDSDPRGNKGFTLKGKPALELLREYTEMVRNSRLCGDGKLRFSIIDD